MNEFFDLIKGQENPKKILTSIIKTGRVPHAFLFYGPEGVGKFFTAIQFSKLLLYNQDSTSNEIKIKKLLLLQEPYIKLVLPLPRGKGESSDDSSIEKLSKDQIEALREEIKSKAENPYHKIIIEKANTIKINSIRDVKRFLELSYGDLSYRFVIVLDADLMNDQAQNALLKSLEEPPEEIIFFLITSDKEKLLSTIQSRCWPVQFEPLPNDIIAEVLIKYFKIDESTANKASYFSNGSATAAADLTREDLRLLLDTIISFLRFSIGRKYYSAFQELSSLIQNDVEGRTKLIFRLIKNWLIDVIKVNHSYNNYYFNDYIETFSKFNERYGAVRIDEVIRNLDKIENHFNQNINLNVLILNIIFELARLSSKD